MDNSPSDNIITSEEEFLDDFENIKVTCPLCNKEFVVYGMESGSCETEFSINKYSHPHASYEYNYGGLGGALEWGWKWMLYFNFNNINYIVEVYEKRIRVIEYGTGKLLTTFDFIPLDENFITNLQNLLLLA